MPAPTVAGIDTGAVAIPIATPKNMNNFFLIMCIFDLLL
jgi:hypothetical protein